MKTLALLAIFAVVAFADDTCPNFGSWLPWTDKCLWFPFNEMRQDLINACDVKVTNLEAMPTFPSPPEGFPTSGCGHCSFKARCKKREKQDGCNPVEIETEHCHDGAAGEICNMPKIVRPHYNIGCKYAIVPMLLQQCANRPGLPDWRREQMLKFQQITPKFHCTEKDDACACCCHPYVPNADGTECVMHEEPVCEPWTEWNDWSEKCLFFPPPDMKKDFEEHCDFDFQLKKGGKPPPFFEKLKLPGVEQPSKCGFCSFKVKCRQRPTNSAAGKKECFPLDVQKKACGNDECEGCGDVCELPKIGGDCNYNEKIRKLVGPAVKSKIKKMPVSMRHHIVKLVTGLPHGKCVEKDDKCMCCCHPYEPNADGTACEVKPICQTPDEVGVEFDMNLPADDSWAWLF